MTRLFVAAWLPHDVADRLAMICQVDEPGIRRLAAEQLHITLRFLGDIDPDETTDRLAACTLPPAVARVGPAVQRLRGGQLVVPVTGVDALATAVDEATAGLGEVRRRPFRGHVTLARARRNARSSIDHREVTAEFPVEDVRLVASRLDHAGAVYDTVTVLPIGRVTDRLRRDDRRSRSRRS